jgi:hypothetical protein
MLGDRAGNAIFMFTAPAGDYYLLATTDPLPDTWRDAAFLERAARLATRISVVEGETIRQDLTAVTIGR